jgi:hypothetical protein
LAYEIIWPKLPDITVEEYIIRIGKHSRDYSEKITVENLTEVSVSTLPLYLDAPNFISISFVKDGREMPPSEEIILFQIGENQIDSDKDGLADDFEQKIGTDPKKADSDEDRIPDGEELATWGIDRVENKIDFDEDNIPNIIDPDSDNDGIYDGDDSDIRHPYFFLRYKNKTEKEKDTKFVSSKKDKEGNVIIQTPEIKSSWSKNPEKNLAGYKILYGVESRKYNHIIDVGLTATPENPKKTITLFTTLNQWKNKRDIVFYIACIAYNTDGIQSDLSEEIIYKFPNPYFKPFKPQK